MSRNNKLVASAGHFHLGHRRSCWIAQNQGWFAEENLEIELIATGHDELTLKGLLEGRIDVILDLRTDKFLMARARGEDIYIIGGFRNTFPFKLIAAKGINSIADLRGRRVGCCELEGVETVHLRHLFTAHGLDPDRDVTFVRAGKEPHQFAAFREGRIDAYGAGETGDNLLAEGFTLLADFTKFYPNGYQERVLVVTGKAAAERPGALTSFMKGVIRGNRFIQDPANPRRVLDYTYRLLETDRLRGGEWAAEAERDWPSCQKENYSHFTVPLDGSISREGLELAMQDEKAAGKIPADMRSADFLRLDFVEAAREAVDAQCGPGGYVIPLQRSQ